MKGFTVDTRYWNRHEPTIPRFHGIWLSFCAYWPKEPMEPIEDEM